MHWLSSDEAMVLADGLDVSVRQFPFHFTGGSPLIEDQQKVALDVASTLTARGLFRAGKLDADLETALRLLGDYRYAIAVLGTVDKTREIYARLHSDGRHAVLIEQREAELGLKLLEPYELCSSAADLLPDLAPARGQSMTVYGKAQPRDGDEFMVPAFGSGRGPQADKIAAILSRERLGTGYFVPSVVDARGKHRQLDAVNWLDNDLGRYMITGGAGDQLAGSAGRPWASYTPADKKRIREQLHHALFEEEDN